MPKMTKRSTQARTPKKATQTSPLPSSTSHPEYMAVGPCAWGKGKTVEEAVKNCRPNLPSGYPSRKLSIYTCTEDAHVDGYGRVMGLGELVKGEEMRASRVTP